MILNNYPTCNQLSRPSDDYILSNIIPVIIVRIINLTNIPMDLTYNNNHNMTEFITLISNITITMFTIFTYHMESNNLCAEYLAIRVGW